MLGRDRSYCVKKNTDSTKKLSDIDIIKRLEFLIDKIFIIFGGHVFQQTVSIPLGTNCAPILVYLFFYLYVFMQGFLRKNEKNLA